MGGVGGGGERPTKLGEDGLVRQGWLVGREVASEVASGLGGGRGVGAGMAGEEEE